MGVRGLTTFIAKNSDRYLHPHRLHDTYLVIDGNNLAVQLYCHSKCYDCFGGDYDAYTKAITDFFETLKKCNITPLIIFDGCYENKKLRTIFSRFRSRINSARKLNPGTEGSMHVFPLFLRELFTEVVIKLGLKTLRCDFEADYEMACLARTLNCPVLSYDSDFYIFDVLYVPFTTVNMQYRRVEKATTFYFYIDCKLYKIENFLNSLGGMDKSNLPLLAVLLGNDYIKMSAFSNFYKQLKLVTRKSAQNDQQRRIETVTKWLRKETYETAAKKILGRVKLIHRNRIANQIKMATDGYICTRSKLLPSLGITISDQPPEKKIETDIDLTNITEECEDDTTSEDADSVESEDDIDEGNDLEIDTLNNVFPEWFLKEYRSCNFPAWFVDISLHNRYFLIPQVENYEDKFSHHISLDLISALHKILTSGKKPQLTYITRDDDAKLKTFLLDRTEMTLPTLEEVESFDVQKRRAILLDILCLKDGTDKLDKFPVDWRLLILSLMFWVKRSEIRVSNNHIYAIILCTILLKIVDTKIGYCRTLKVAQKIDKTFRNDKAHNDGDSDNISKRDCLNYVKEMVPYFYMDEKMYRNPRVYDVCVTDAFSRFQSCLYHIKYLNKVLNKPFQDVLVSDFYNGTFVYGVFTNLNKRQDPMAYINNLLSNAKGILNYFTNMSTAILDGLDTVAVSSGKKRRRRKQHSKSRDSVNSKTVCVVEEREDVVLDKNNPYSILNFV